MDSSLRRPWLVAVWPGMGGVAQIAGTYLVQQLRAEAVGELDPRGHFDLPAVAVKRGLLQPFHLPRSVFYAWRDPQGDRDLLILLGDNQPTQHGYRYCEELLDIAARHGVERVVTFAAMATPILPGGTPRVFGVCTRGEHLGELKRDGIRLLEDGQVSGLNGVFIAVAAARNLPGFCLLGEFPFFAAAVPNPKASAAVLRAFGTLSDIRVDMGDLDTEARRIERGLTKHLEGLQRAARRAARSEEREDEVQHAEDEDHGDDEQDEHPGGGPPGTGRAGEGPLGKPPASAKGGRPAPEPRPVGAELAARLEVLFEQSARDRAKALELKAELDRHGLFRQYEDRFLDLFKQGG